MGAKALDEARTGLALGQPIVAPRTIQVIRREDDLDALASAWDSLAPGSGSPMQQHAWAKACAATFAADGELHMVAIGAPSRVTAIAPLVRRPGGLGRFELLGTEELDEPADFLFADPPALGLLTDTLAELGRPLFLRRLPASSPVVPALRRSYRGRGIVICRPDAGYPSIPHVGSIQPEQRLNAGRRSDFRRAWRMAKAMGRVSVDVLSPAPGELGPLLEEAFRVEAASWKGREGTALARDPARRAFYRRYAAAAAQLGILRLCFLRIDGQAAAMQLAVESGERFWLLKIGYDEAFARCSPGTLLILETVRYAAERGLRSYEFLGTIEPWTKMWTQFVRPCVSVRAYPATGHGMAALASDLARIACRKSGQALRSANGRKAEKGTSSGWRPLAKRAARAYVAGPELADALRVCRWVSRRAFASTVGFWNGDGEGPRQVADAYLIALDAVTREHLNYSLSVKAPAFRFSRDLFAEVLERSHQGGVFVHFDSLGPETVEQTLALVGEALPRYRDLGCTLPGRWRRSLRDADWAAELGLRVRVVKGQWGDPDSAEIDPRAGFLAVVDRLAGRARHVGVATHDAALAQEALGRLRAAHTSCELELLFGLPLRRAARVARAAGVPVRLYIPYGHASLPYSLSQARQNPRVLWWAARDLALGRSFRLLGGTLMGGCSPWDRALLITRDFRRSSSTVPTTGA